MKRKSAFRENKKVKIVKRGNWCGGGWTAGQAKDASEMKREDYYVPALSSQDQNCKDHDIALYEASTKEDVEKAHQEFYMNSADSIEGRVQSNLVYMFGPTDPNPKKRKRQTIRRDHLSKSKKVHMTQNSWWTDSHPDPKPKNLPKPLPAPPRDPGLPPPAPAGPNVIPADDPMGMSPQMVATSNSVNNKTHETAVDPVHDVIMKPFRKVQNVRLPYLVF